MDIKLANIYIISFLLILNLILFGINSSFKINHTITKSQEDFILSYLEQNNILCEIDIPKSFSPIEQLTMKKTKFEESELIELFFDGEIVEKSSQFDTEIFIKDGKKLTVSGNTLYFENLEKIDGFINTEINAEQLALSYVNKLSKNYGELEKDFVSRNDNHFLLIYTKPINNIKNFSNSLSIRIYDDGSVIIYFNSYTDYEIPKETKNIYSSYEMLYLFANEMSNIGNEAIYIDKIDLGYFLKSDKENINFKFEPAYRIYLSNTDIPFFINAYSNSFEYNTGFNSY